MKNILPIFSPQEVNTKRQNELDLLKAVTIFVMIFGHITEVFFSREWEDLAFCDFTLPWRIFYIGANSVVAFGFMFSMGASIPFSRNQSAAIWIMRGVKLILAWFILHLLYFYPMASIFAAEHEKSFWEFTVEFLCSSDILFFAGAFFIFIGILRKFNAGLRSVFIVSAVFFAASHFVRSMPLSDVAGRILGNFIITEGSFFPFFNWIMAPVFGMCWGTMLRHCTNKNKLYLFTGALGVIGTAILLIILYMKDYLSAEGFSRLGDVKIFYDANIATVAVSCSFLAIVLSFYYLVTQMVQAQWFIKTYQFLSKQLTNIYFIQWLIIPWTAFFLPRPTEEMSMWWSILAAIIIMCACIPLSVFYSKLKSLKNGSASNTGR